MHPVWRTQVSIQGSVWVGGPVPQPPHLLALPARQKVATGAFRADQCRRAGVAAAGTGDALVANLHIAEICWEEGAGGGGGGGGCFKQMRGHSPH